MIAVDMDAVPTIPMASVLSSAVLTVNTGRSRRWLTVDHHRLCSKRERGVRGPVYQGQPVGSRVSRRSQSAAVVPYRQVHEHEHDVQHPGSHQALIESVSESSRQGDAESAAKTLTTRVLRRTRVSLVNLEPIAVCTTSQTWEAKVSGMRDAHQKRPKRDSGGTRGKLEMTYMENQGWGGRRNSVTRAQREQM